MNLDKIKSILNEWSQPDVIKGGMAKSKGMTHLAYNNYMGPDGKTLFYWDKDKRDFIKAADQSKAKEAVAIKSKYGKMSKQVDKIEKDVKSSTSGKDRDKLKSQNLLDVNFNLDKKELFEKLAVGTLNIETLETRGRDSLDFHDISVGRIRTAITIAYEAGFKAGEKSR